MRSRVTFETKAGEVMAAVKYYLSIGHSPCGMPTRQVGSFELDEQRQMHVSYIGDGMHEGADITTPFLLRCCACTPPFGLPFIWKPKTEK